MYERKDMNILNLLIFYQYLLISFNFFPSDKSNLEEAERTLYALKKLGANKECITSLLDGLTNYIRIVLTLTDNSECPSVEKAINELLNQILQVMRS